MQSRRRVLSMLGAAALAATAAPALAACGSGAAPGEEAKTIRVAKQPGLGYLQFMVMADQKLVEKRAPGVTMEWRELSNGNAIRDAMIAGQLDVGSGGVAPFEIGWDKGVKWRTLGTLNQMPLYLNVNRPEVKTLKDLKDTDRIALPTLGSIQHITLQMAAEQQLGNPKALDNQLVAMSHPDGQAALLSKREITGHFTSPPFQYLELEAPGITKILDSFEVLGAPATFNLVWSMEDWQKKNPKLFKAFVEALQEATDLINRDARTAAEIYIRSENSKDPPEKVVQQMTSPGIKYTTVPTGMMKYAEFMKRTGVVDKVPGGWKDYVFDNLAGAQGS